MLCHRRTAFGSIQGNWADHGLVDFRLEGQRHPLVAYDTSYLAPLCPGGVDTGRGGEKRLAIAADDGVEVLELLHILQVHSADVDGSVGLQASFHLLHLLGVQVQAESIVPLLGFFFEFRMLFFGQEDVTGEQERPRVRRLKVSGDSVHAEDEQKGR